MKPNTYKIIQEAVENGVALGYNKFSNTSYDWTKTNLYF